MRIEYRDVYCILEAEFLIFGECVKNVEFWINAGDQFYIKNGNLFFKSKFQSFLYNIIKTQNLNISSKTTDRSNQDKRNSFRDRARVS